MKKIFLSICVLFLVFANVSAQEKMIVLKSDGSQIEFDVDEVVKVLFQQIILNPNNPQGEVSEAIDLGLSCLWAKWNVGASSIWDAGGLYGWGDPDGTKAATELDEYPSTNPPSSICGTDYDIARKRWGGEWRMPTYEEMRELVMECDWSITVKNNVKYLRATGPNENSIIIPLTGYRIGTDFIQEDSYYLTGTLCEEDETTDHYAYGLCIDMSESTVGMTALNRMYGFGIRPVCDKKQKVSVTTGNVSNLKALYATLSATISGIESAVECGFIYDTTNTLDENYGIKQSTTAKDTYSVTLTELKASTKYYYRAYALVGGKYVFGDIADFTTMPEKKVSVTTGEANNIKEKSVTLTGTMTDTDDIYTCGFIYGTNSDIDIYNANSKKRVGVSSSFEASITNLTPDTKYYYRAFVILQNGWTENNTIQGETKSFTTADVITQGKSVDLGLSVKWAGYNVGATSPEGYGNYYAQESAAKAASDFGYNFRLPTKAEMQELVDKCKWENYTYKGIYGKRVTGPNGNSIFLPFTGQWVSAVDDGEVIYNTVWFREDQGHYWSSTSYFNYRFNGKPAYDVYNDYFLYLSWNGQGVYDRELRKGYSGGVEFRLFIRAVTK